MESLITCPFINTDIPQYRSMKLDVTVAAIANDDQITRIITPDSDPIWLITTLYMYRVITRDREPICFSQIICDREVKKWQIVQCSQIRRGTYELFSVHDRDIILKEISRLIH